MTDLKLIEECRGGNLNNFRKLIESTSPFVFSIAFRMLGDEDQAKDIVQETMVTIWQKIDKINSAEGYRKWICFWNQLMIWNKNIKTFYF